MESFRVDEQAKLFARACPRLRMDAGNEDRPGVTHGPDVRRLSRCGDREMHEHFRSERLSQRADDGERAIGARRSSVVGAGVTWCLGPGVTCSEVPVFRVQPATLD